MGVEAVLDLFAVGAAALALWCIVRFPSLGPRSLRSAFIVVALAFVALPLVGFLVVPVAVAVGAGAALVLLVLPALTFSFWAGGCFVRFLLGAQR